MPWHKQLRADALAILSAGVAAVEPRELVRSHLERAGALVPDGTEIQLAAVGKAAWAMVHGAIDVLGERVAGGVVVAPSGATQNGPARLRAFEGGHPIPNEEGVRGALAIGELAAGLDAGACLLTLISGGGSALMTLPPAGVALEDVQATTEALLRAGASIHELNCVRKHLDLLKGGRLARAAEPARVVALILSDVVGDPLDVIASGPVSPDPTTFSEALAIVERFGIAGSAPAPVRTYLERGANGDEPESPKPDDPCFDRVETSVVGSNRVAAAAALEAALARGYATELLTTERVGEAREVGKELAALGREIRDGVSEPTRPACLIVAGETTVTVAGRGRGGRNQEVALGAALALAETDRILIASMGTDGIDGPTDAAGALADGRTCRRADSLGLDPRERLADNDAYAFFKVLDDLIVTGPTGTNVMDLMLVLVADD